MGRRGIGIVLGFACALAGPGVVQAADIGSVTAAPAPVDAYGIDVPPAQQNYITPIQEVRLGVFDHNMIHNENAPVDVSIEVLSSTLHLWDTTNPWISWFFNPRLNAGGMINTEGGTSYGFVGLTWRIPIYQKFFFEGEFGGAVNNSPLYPDGNRVDMGCRFTFRESGGFGYQFNEHFDLIGSVEHVSHATFCTHINPGLTQVGLRVGYKF
jgi:lipid A 3-O-deacylase